MKKFTTTFFAILFILISTNAFATHNMAGDISYQHISGNTYRFTVRTFCKYHINSPNGNTDRCELPLIIGNDTIILPRINGPSIVCATADGDMICPEIRYNLYVGEYIFPGMGLYKYKMDDPNRNSGICNIPFSENTSFTLEGEIVINGFYGSNAYNDAPQYGTAPIMNNDVGLVSIYNPQITNTDGDSLYYDFKLTEGATLPPASNSFTINHQTGEIIWDVPTLICAYAIEVIIKEYKKTGMYYGGHYIEYYYYRGSTMQEIYAVPINCPNLLSVNDIDKEKNIDLYPNPSQGTFEIKTNDIKIESIRITDMLGKEIKLILNFPSTGTISIDLGDVKNGIHFVQILDEEQTKWNEKIIKQ